ncbi:RNA-binding protein [Helicobacter saguini]|uniref:RNA-binding protein n=1 Tax=Helicobacter saguini TaxID=1548018 RepID=A0A347VNF2_9HELI|nr:hypothetical protein [Helicobacter saguini]MWV61792.1 RNA-binding protein [Helicobacter saguini]MWV67533.1 RNA-binding protein [Helicobacter saguini]MWV69885.1 RNA-binding protein [Helicobacter saguini]MWV72898.1 RNA-binding protein [Helicobacter saguini]TLD93252.1 RNA-binding protein [Helicobacter saguini]
MKSIYIGNLVDYVTQKEILDLFAQFGEVISISIIRDKKTKQCKGYAFVEMENKNANTAISMLNNDVFMGRNIIVREATKNKNTFKSL